MGTCKMRIEVRHVCNDLKELKVEGCNVTMESGVLDRKEAIELSKELIQAALELLED